jgi:hypothetical protein
LVGAIDFSTQLCRLNSTNMSGCCGFADSKKKERTETTQLVSACYPVTPTEIPLASSLALLLFYSSSNPEVTSYLFLINTGFIVVLISRFG